MTSDSKYPRPLDPQAGYVSANRVAAFSRMSNNVNFDSLEEISLKCYNDFLNDYIFLKNQLLGEVLECTCHVLSSWVEVNQELAEHNRMHGSAFNPLATIPIKEPVHSRIIGDLLNPKGCHGQCSLFLQCFLELINVPYREHDVWKISIETGRVDILLWRESPASMIIIENKVKDAIDQPNQIFRYWHHQMYCWKPQHSQNEESRRAFRLIYLPADGSKEPAPHSLERPVEWSNEINPYKTVPLECQTISLATLMDRWHEQVIKKIPATNSRLHVFFQLYRELWIKS